MAWLSETRAGLAETRAKRAAPARADPSRTAAVTFRVGVPGPVAAKKLRRIAEICDVPSFALGDVFASLDADGSGTLDAHELKASKSPRPRKPTDATSPSPADAKERKKKTRVL